MGSKKNEIVTARRDFLRKMGTGALLLTTAAMPGCTRKKAVGYIAEGNSQEVPTDAMTYRVNHNTGDKASILGYGMMRLPNKKNADGEDEIDQQKVNELVDYAIAHGVNYYDTAPVYCRGLSERSTGIALNRHPRTGYLIATKLSNMRNHSLKDGIAMFENSLKELQVDYVDYLLLHSLGTKKAYEDRFINNGLLNYLMEEKRRGRIRNLGWSFHGEKEFFDYMVEECGVHWDFIQIQMNYVDWNRGNPTAEHMYNQLVKYNIPAVIMEPLLGGRLAKMNYQAMAMLKQREPEKSVASWAFRFAGHYDNVLTVLSGMTYLEHLQDNIITYSPLKKLSDDELEILQDVATRKLGFENINCTDCQYCMPCPYGLDIPKIFAHYNRCLDEGQMPQNELDADYKQQRRAFLVGLERGVPKMRQADKCTGCRECEEQCPQKIKISRELQKIDRFVNNLMGDGQI